jgi:predicted SAM-dependent methyltransferase
MLKNNITKILEELTGYKIFLTKVSTNNPSQDFLRLKNNYPNIQPLKLHFGCGPRILKGWINIDLVYTPYESFLKYYGDTFYPVQVRGSHADFYSFNPIIYGLPLPDNSVDLIFHEDFIEHLDQKEQILFLAETYRIMKPGTIHRINTPNLISSMKTKSDFNKGLQGVYKEEWENNQHKCVLTKTYLEEIAYLTGYKKVLFNNKNESSSKEIPPEYRPAGDRDTLEGNIFADLIK